ncbi:lysosomal proton-coupled steroid conjugate and bile acid symporter SLC46A3-like [Culicoides brevitarsis]|uniref:lysosomal proton-coupled steroid conjugate and bile acid symporter SLC46A3-like n=1 Tax=Culicoides brevitarsis TaxID=469753 RepID=UPI00307B5EBB
MILSVVQRAKKHTSELWAIRNHLRIEACAFFFFLSGFLLIIGMSVFELEKACRVNLRLEPQICDNLNNIPYKEMCVLLENDKFLFQNGGNSTDELRFLLENVQAKGHNVKGLSELVLIHKVCEAEEESQKLISKMYAIRSPIATIFILLIVLFAGSWSDKHDIRKAFILVPFIGEILASVINVVSAIYMNHIPADYVIYGGKIIPSIFGGQTLFMIGVHSYMTVTTTEEHRTFRIGVYSMFFTFLGIFASPLSGFLFEMLNYVELFSLCLTIQTIGFFFVIFCLPEVKAEDTKSEKSEKSLSLKELCKDFFDPSHIIDAFSVLKKPREGNFRKTLIFVIICNTLFFATIGEEGLIILFTRKQLNWTIEFSIFVMYLTAVNLIGTGISTLFFAKLMKMSDPVLGIISTIGTIIGNPVLAFSKTNLMIYTSGTIDIFFQARYIAVKSMLSKLVEKNELGRVYSVLGVTENIDSIIFTPVYSLIYYKTLDFMPGAFFLFSEIFLVGALFVFGYLVILTRNNNSEEPKDQNKSGEKDPKEA